MPRAAKLQGATVIYLKRRYRFWKSRELDGAIKFGGFVEDARGRWYVTFVCEVPENRESGAGEIGIDLGLSTYAATSDGQTIEPIKAMQRHAERLAVAQRANNRPRERALHAKIANTRQHFLHEASSRLVRDNQFIAVGDVSAATMKTAPRGLRKGAYDAGWSAFRHMLDYKARRHRAVLIVVDERDSSRSCSCCLAVGPDGSPKGRAGLRIRRWECGECGAVHDRDINAALNILRVGLERQPPAREIVVS